MEGIEIGKAEGIEIGKAEGIEIGKAEGILQTAKNLKNMGLSSSDIQKATGLTELPLTTG